MSDSSGVRLRIIALLLFAHLSIAAFAAKNEQVVIMSNGSRQELKAKVLAAGGTIRPQTRTNQSARAI